MQKIYCILLLLFILEAQSHGQREIKLKQYSISGSINQKIPIKVQSKFFLPNTKIFSATTGNKQDLQYLSVQQAEIFLWQQSEMTILPQKVEGLFQYVRSYRSSSFRHILIVEDKNHEKLPKYVFIYEEPNIVLVYREENKELVSVAKYGIEGITSNRQTKLYEYIGIQQKSDHDENNSTNITEDNQQSKVLGGLLVIQNERAFYRISTDSARKLKLQQPVSLAYLQFMGDDVIITAQYEKGVGIYDLKYNQGKANKISSFTCKDFGLSNDNKNCSITDLSYSHKKKQLYILDSNSGVHLYQLEQEMNSQTGFLTNSFRLAKSEPILVTQVYGCETMDFISQDHFILICLDSQSRNSYLLEVVETMNLFTMVKTFEKKDPMYHSCTFSDILATEDYYIAYDRESIDIFWNSVESGLFMIQHTKNHLNFPGLQAFTIRKQKIGDQIALMMYGVQSGTLLKYQLKTNPGSVQLFSEVPIKKSLTVIVSGPCPQIVEATLQHASTLSAESKQEQQKADLSHSHPIPSLQDQECLYYQPIKLNINEAVSSQHAVSISLGIIIMMLIILVVLVCICYHKYHSMEVYSRRLLQKYKNKITNKENFQALEI